MGPGQRRHPARRLLRRHRASALAVAREAVAAIDMHTHAQVPLHGDPDPRTIDGANIDEARTRQRGGRIAGVALNEP